MNGDGSVDNLDLVPWQLALQEPVAFAQLYPNVDPIAQGDIVGNGELRLNIGAFSEFMARVGGLVTEPQAQGPIFIGVPASLFFGSLQDTEVVSGGIAGAESQRPDATIRIYYGGDMNGDGAVNNLDINPSRWRSRTRPSTAKCSRSSTPA